jgi:hypothetical protein
MRVPRAAWAGVAIAAALTTTACSSDWGDSELVIRYDGTHRGKVAACSDIARARAVVEDQPGSSGTGVVDEVQLEELETDTWEINAQLTLGQPYSWRCTVTIDREARTMEADVRSFEVTSR